MGKNLTRLRHAAGLTQAQLAERAGVARATVSNLESGYAENLEVGTMRVLASALGAQLIDLLDEPHGTAPIAPVLDAYLESDAGRALGVTAEEEGWLRGLPGIVWVGVPPNPQAIELLVLAHRAARE